MIDGSTSRLLYDLEGQVDRTEGKLAAATRRMEFFMRKAEGECLLVLMWPKVEILMSG